MKMTTALRSSFAQQLIAAMAAGTTNPNPVIQMYANNMPSSMGGTIFNTLLGTLTLTPSVGTETDGVITFDTITEDSSADDSGTATWCRILDRDGNEVIYLTVADDGSGEIYFNTAEIVAGAPIAIPDLTLTIGGA